MITYRAVGKKHCFENRKGIFTYSILAFDSEGRMVSEIDDISANREAVMKLVDAMNRNCLSIAHFQDVIEDFLVGEY